MAQTNAARQARYRARKQAKRDDELAALKREIAALRTTHQQQLDDRAVTNAALEREIATLREDKIALSEALRAEREAVKRPAKVVEVARGPRAPNAAPRRTGKDLAKFGVADDARDKL
jgi:hypothetical protein